MALGYYARLAGITAQIQGIDALRLARISALGTLYRSSDANDDSEDGTAQGNQRISPLFII
jgi:hypothetical protein